MSFSSIGLALQIVIALIGAFFLAFWVSLVVWTFRDVRSRSRDIFAQLLAVLMVIVFNVAGLILYFILRPQETLAEKYERALEEEALLQDIEERYNCPGCRQKIRPSYQFCPSCHTRLKQPCSSCGELLLPQWDLCPYCGATPPPLIPVTKSPAVSRPVSSPASPAAGRQVRSAVRDDTIKLTEFSSGEVIEAVEDSGEAAEQEDLDRAFQFSDDTPLESPIAGEDIVSDSDRSQPGQ